MTLLPQTSFAQAEYAKKKKRTRREVFLAKMEQVVPWTRLLEVIEPHYPKSGRRGRPPIGLEKMLRMYFVQQWYGLADEAVEDAIYDSQALRNFLGIDLSRQSVPDATTLMGFRRLLEAHHLPQTMLVEVNAMLIERGLLMSKGTLVDATLIAAPSSTKNREHARDPEMHQTKKGNTWHFGLKAHIGVDQESGLVHTLVTTAANVSDISQTSKLLHGQEEAIWADAGYVGGGSARTCRRRWRPTDRNCNGTSPGAARRSRRWPRAGRKTWRKRSRSSRRGCARLSSTRFMW
jgi:IS5 family transposase